MNRRNVLKLGGLSLLSASPLVAHAQSKGGLSYQVFTATRPGLNREVPPGKESLMWVANSSTLISGKNDAVLVDTFLTVAQCEELADKIARTGKRLRTIYVTHAHGDHFLGLKVLLDRFPDARALATPDVVATMRTQTTPEKLDGRWRKLFPGQISEVIAICEPMTSDTIELEGEKLTVVKVGHTDTDNSTCLHVPSIGLVVAGDAVYNGIHPFLIESTHSNRLQWIAALDKIEALKPQYVVAGHKVPTHDDSPRNIEETRQYIRDFIRLDASTTSARDLYDQMLALYPDRANPGSLWSSAQAAKAQGS
ncbi:MBL fold metallo-hydrolase [Cupriavidus pampae]|uniref:Hydroxyacylglutathione hydrolase n=1 Tax=Cupriavidus pampae TaxID=659251 RepID=A0ABM8XWS8_9BURK|nr:MBL fold metallo-hydrolase [Cupriavidus pampae]CAG9184877.1 Hydroxyacylglutathione hydrolase [Cupriavidus pampae]